MKFKKLVLLISAMLLSSCTLSTAPNTPNPTLSPVTIPSATYAPIVPTPTLTPIPSATFAPSATPSPTPTRTPIVVQIPALPGNEACTYRATFLGDVTIPDNTVIQPRASFVKTWRVRNDGTCTWGSSYALNSLSFLRGERMDAPSSILLPPEVKPGSIVDLSVPMVAPTMPDRYYLGEWVFPIDSATWIGVGASGQVPLAVQIIVGVATTPSLSRVSFQAGATHAVVTGTLTRGQSQDYVVNARQGQIMMLALNASGKMRGLDVWHTLGTYPEVIQRGFDGLTWAGKLLADGDYVIRVTALDADVTFSLGVTIPQRITFAPNTFTTVVTGLTNSRRTISYLLAGTRGQIITVSIEAPPNAAALAIYGLGDGKPLIRTEAAMASWTGALPATQDYVIDVVTAADQALNFSVRVILGRIVDLTPTTGTQVIFLKDAPQNRSLVGSFNPQFWTAGALSNFNETLSGQSLTYKRFANCALRHIGEFTPKPNLRVQPVLIQLSPLVTLRTIYHELPSNRSVLRSYSAGPYEFALLLDLTQLDATTSGECATQAELVLATITMQPIK